MGIGGTPEGVISAAAIKCLGGAIQGKLWPRDDGGTPEARRRRLRRRQGADDRRPRRRRQRVRRGDRRHERRAAARCEGERAGSRDRVDRDALPERHGEAHRRLPSIREGHAPSPRFTTRDERSSGDVSARLARDRPRDRRRSQGHPRRRRVHRDDQEALRLDRRRDRPRRTAAPTGTCSSRRPASRSTSAASSSTTRRSARAPTTARRSRAARRRRASSPGSRSTPAPSRWRCTPARSSRSVSTACRERCEEYVGLGARFAKWRAVITIGDGIPTRGCIRRERARARPLRGASARRQASCRSSSPRC